MCAWYAFHLLAFALILHGTVCYLEVLEATDTGLVDLAAAKAVRRSTRSHLLSSPISELLARVESERTRRVVEDAVELASPSRKRQARQPDDDEAVLVQALVLQHVSSCWLTV